MTPEELSRSTREAFAYAARYIGLLVQNNPEGSAASVLTRPDVDAVLLETLEQARAVATEAVRQQWAASGGGQHEYLTWLIDDVDRSYDALGSLRASIHRAYTAVPVRHFQPGVTPPGKAPVAASGRDRAASVRQAVLDVGSHIALRNRLALEVAGTAAQTVQAIQAGTQREMAGQTVYKQWLCSSSPPDPETCHWCRALHGMIVPLHGNFPAGHPADLTGHGRLTRPPRLYHGMLQGPPRHPRCRCHLKILTDLPSPGGRPVPSGPGGQGGAGASAAPQQEAPGSTERTAERAASSGSLLAASDIRALSEEKYQSLIHFIRSAAHELGQVLARLRKVSGK
jgi:hypothetical protein